jgi:hypothetical protein
MACHAALLGRRCRLGFGIISATNLSFSDLVENQSNSSLLNYQVPKLEKMYKEVEETTFACSPSHLRPQALLKQLY